MYFTGNDSSLCVQYFVGDDIGVGILLHMVDAIINSLLKVSVVCWLGVETNSSC